MLSKYQPFQRWKRFLRLYSRKNAPPRQTCLPGALLILLSPKEIAKKFTIRFSCSRIRLVIVKIISILLYSYRLNRTFYKHESGCFVGEGMKLKQQIKKLTGRDVYVSEYEDIKRSDRVDSDGRASYVVRNYWMVENSDYVIIYIKKNYSLSRSISGTWVVYQYAIKKKYNSFPIALNLIMADKYNNNRSFNIVFLQADQRENHRFFRSLSR